MRILPIIMQIIYTYEKVFSFHLSYFTFNAYDHSHLFLQG